MLLDVDKIMYSRLAKHPSTTIVQRFLEKLKKKSQSVSSTMAEGVFFDIASTVLKKLGSLALQEIVLLWGLNDELEKLQRTVSTINAVLLDAEKQYWTSNEVRVWLDDLKDAVYDADDLLDDISTEASRVQQMSGNVGTNEVRLCFSQWNMVTYGLKMARKIRNIRAKLGEIAENRKFHLVPKHVEPAVVDHLRDVSTHSTPANVVIGRDDDKKNILSLLLGEHHDNLTIIPIVGFGGLGKTTLAQAVYNDRLVKTHFDLRMWVCLSDTFNVRSIVEKMIECPGQNEDVQILENRLYARIKGKRYLIVLDDVWNEDREKWLQLIDLISDGARGSRVVITTRNTKVAETTSKMEPYQLKALCEVESWVLFKQLAFKQGQAPNGEFEAIGKEITARCAGLPLAIRTIGSLLYTKTEVFEWKSFKDEEFLKLDPKSHIVETLKLSYNHLPSYLKHCFSYCSLFPKDYLFEVPTLINHWRAQGYIDTSERGPLGEDAGADCFKYLLQRSFFQLANVNDFGDVVNCRMHDFMHDLALLVAGEESKMVYPNPNGETVTGKTLHMSLHEIPASQQWQHLAPLLQKRKARTFVVQRHGFYSSGFTKSGDKQCRAIVDKLKCLRVLMLHGCGIKKLPSFIDRLKHLRQLDLSFNKEIAMLPDSIIQLLNLQVLNLDCCYLLKKLPKNIKKLVNLIHLGLESCYCLEEMPQGIGRLTSLEVLPLFMLSPWSRLPGESIGRLDELQNLNKLRGRLEILNLGYVTKGAQELAAANLKEKPHLRFLRLDWGGYYEVEDMSSEEKSFEALQPHVNLNNLRLQHYGGARFPRWVSSLENLVKIEIEWCRNFKSLSPLDGLPSLQHLVVWHLFELEYMIDNTGNTEGAGEPCLFPKLESLTLHGCFKLKGWWSTEEPLRYQMPCLSKLVISSCPNLIGRMPQLPSLKNLELQEGISVELLEETLKQVKPPLTSTYTTVSPLQSLLIERINNLWLLREEALQSLASLKSLQIAGVADTRVLSPWLHHLPSLERLIIRESSDDLYMLEETKTELIQCLGNLRYLEIVYCEKMKSLPGGIQHLTSLETLKIKFCHLASLPEWIGNLISLNCLEIRGCDHLSERCKSKQGEDWPSISHIPNIKVDDERVQRNGRYQL